MMKKLFLAAAFLATFATNVSAQTDGDYYLYDATNGVFLSRGGSYGTQATVDKYGVPFTWASSTGKIVFKDWAKVGLHIESDNTTVYTDNGTPTQFAFVTTTGGYYLENSGKTSYAYEDAGAFKMTTDASKAIVWTLKSKAERDAIVNAYPTTNMTDVITAASLSSATTAANFETYLSANYVARSVQTIAPTDYTWKQYSRADANSSSPREVYQGTGIFTKTITGLTKGIYKITTYAFERDGGNADCVTLNKAGYNIATSCLTAGSEQVRIKAWAEERLGDANPNTSTQANTAFNAEKYANSVYAYVGDAGTLDLSVVVPSFCWLHWFIFGNTVLTYYGSTFTESEATTAISNAKTLLEKPMEATYNTALTNALAAFQASETNANYNSLIAATSPAQISVNAYSTFISNTTALANIKTLVDNTNVYTKDAYDKYYLTPKYDNRTLTTSEALLPIENPNTKTGWRADNDVQSFLMSAWGGTLSDWSNLHINTWSPEGESDGSNFIVPFYEYWMKTTDTDKSLGAKTMTGTVTGLTAGAYKVSALVRVQKNSTTSVGAITMKVNNGEAVNVTTGTQISSTSSLYMGTFTAYGRVGSDGKLNITINVPASSNISWLSFKNVKYEAVSITTLDESASNTITAASNASVDLKRTIKASTWNTLALPFTLTNDQVVAAFGSDAQVAAYTETSADASNVTVNFNTTTNGITANVPVLLKTSTAGTTYSFDNVNIVAGDPIAAGSKVDFVGSYNANTAVAAGDYLLSSNSLYKSTGPSSIDGFRGYLKFHASGAASINMIIDGETTGITNVNAANNTKEAVRYNLNGQRIYGAVKGIYIENGHKIVK